MVNKLSRFVRLYRLPFFLTFLFLASIGSLFVFRSYLRDSAEVQVIPSTISKPNTDGTYSESNIDSKLIFRVSEGQDQPQDIARLNLVEGDPLPDDEIDEILSRLPELIDEVNDREEFKLPEESLPPPRTGETIAEPFPPTEGTSQPILQIIGPLEVLRFGPEGEIPLAPFINITFNQPMVPLTTLGDLSLEEVPVHIEPALPGTWRWLGTKTLTFQYDSELIDRLPMATEYLVIIPEGTESSTGGILEEAVKFSFNTPPPTVVTSFPYGGPQPLEPIFFTAFDQRVDPKAVLETIQVTVRGKQVPILLASSEEINSDKEISRLLESYPEGRWIAFKTVDPLDADSEIKITIGPGTASAEGPLVTQSTQQFSFRTYAPLEIDEHGCSWYEVPCPPLTPFFIRFNNPINVNAYEERMLKIQPDLPGVSVDLVGDTLTIRGITSGQTTYSINVDGDIQDTFGQKLGKDVTLTFRVGTAEPRLVGPGKNFITLDPASAKPELSLYVINYNRLDVQIYAVEPSDWPAYLKYLQDYQRNAVNMKPPGRQVFDDIMRLEIPTDSLTEIKIDINEVMDGDFGHFIIVAKPGGNLFENDRYWETIQPWVQVTQIGIDAFVDQSEMIVWTSKLLDGSPMEGLQISSFPGVAEAVTDDSGISKFSIPDEGISYLIAKKANDTALLPNSTYFWGENLWLERSSSDYLRWHVFDDRQMYRPGEEVHVKGWLRVIGGSKFGDVGLVENMVNRIDIQVIGAQGNELVSSSVPVNVFGGFDYKFTLPENANLGYGQLNLNANGGMGGLDNKQHYHSFQIQEFRRPEFEVTARNVTSGPYIVGDHAIVAVEAKYFAGGPLPNADVTWEVTSSESTYNPPNWPDFTFGIWKPWWWSYSPMAYESFYEPPYFLEDTSFETFSGVTDSSGNHFLRLDLEEINNPVPFSLIADATVFDVNRQAWVGTTSLLVHPAELYVGLHSERTFVERGTPLEIELIATDIDGKAIEDRQIKVTASRIEWKFLDGGWREVDVDPQECTIGSKVEPVFCTFETPIGGRYKVTALISDSFGRENKSEFTRWVSGGQQPPSRIVEQETVTLIPDKDTYQPGDTAEILVQSPYRNAEGLLTVSRSGILYSERFTIEDGSKTLFIEIEDVYIPNLHVQVDLVGSTDRTDSTGEVIADVPPRPAYASGQLNLSIPPLSRTLSLELTPQESSLEPGGETILDIVVSDANGNPVSDAEFAVVVVDEAILALSNYQLANPINTFYTDRPSELMSVYGRANIILTDPLALLESGGMGGELMAQTTQVVEAESVMDMAIEMPAAAPAEEKSGLARGLGEPSPIKVRTNFNPLAVFSPQVRSDNNGKAKVEISLPDNLTRYRIMVVAVDSNNQFGSAESNLVARLPLMVRPSAPRFLNFGDQFELPIVVQNQTDESIAVDVVVQATNLLLTGNSGVRVNVPANDRVEVRFPATTEMAGTAYIQVAAVSGSYADAATIELPVFTPATTEAFATYGVVDEGAMVQPILSPTNVFPQFGGLEINTSSTALQALTDAVLYLVSYPYECTEQLSSRILGVAALRDVLTAFEADGLPTPAEMEDAVARDIIRLQGLQNFDGGFPYWRRGRESIPFNSIHVAHALQRAESKGFAVPDEMQLNLLAYLQEIESHYPHWYGKRTRQTLSAYALYVRNLMGDQDASKARKLLNDDGVEDFSLDAVGWIWMVLQDTSGSSTELESIRRHVLNRVVETPSAANFTTYYDDQTYLLLSSDRRTDAILMDALISDDSQDELIVKLVNGLLAHQTKGRWNNTQDNVFVLLALDHYFNTFETQTPDFVARIWLGDSYAGGHEFVGRTTERHETIIPMAYLMDSFSEGPTQDLILDKDGTGRLYYRLGLRYAPTDLTLDPLDMGFIVTRSYEGVDDPDDVTLDNDGVWHIKAGARVRVSLKMVADNRRYHVALVDPLPAGLEIVNPSLAVSGNIPQDPSSSDFRYGWWWWGPWYEHQNLRDERAEAFTSLLWDGVYEYSYITRATTPGTFIVPPAKAEEMYSPEVFGRSGSDIVIVD